MLISLHDAQFSQLELCEIAGLETNTANNWVRFKYLEPGKSTDRRLKKRRFFSLAEIFKARVMRSRVFEGRLQPADAAQIADRALTLIEKELPSQDITETIKGAQVHLFYRFIDEHSRPEILHGYSQQGDPVFYTMNPERYPEQQLAMPELKQLEYAMVHITRAFNHCYSIATEVLLEDAQEESDTQT